MQQTRFKFQIPHKWRCIPNKETPVAEAEAGLGCHLCPGLRVSLVENCNSPYSDWTEEKDLSCLLCFLDVVAALWDTFVWLFGVMVQWLRLQWKQHKPSGCCRYFCGQVKPLLPCLWAGCPPGKAIHSCSQGGARRTLKVLLTPGYCCLRTTKGAKTSRKRLIFLRHCFLVLQQVKPRCRWRNSLHLFACPCFLRTLTVAPVTRNCSDQNGLR